MRCEAFMAYKCNRIFSVNQPHHRWAKNQGF